MKHKLSKELDKKAKTSAFLFYLFLALTIIAAICPRWGTDYSVSEYRRGLDAVFAIDVSRSMDIRDAQGGISRLESGLSAAKTCAAAVSGARFAAAIGRGRGLLAVPLTWDNEAVLSFLEVLDGSSMSGRSTNLESLIDEAADAFQSSSPARKVIILISDGEALSGVLGNAVNRCVKDGIIINAVSAGSDEGRQIQENSNDPESAAVISRRESAVMRTIAEKTGGVYIDANRSDAAQSLSAHLLSIARETGVRTGRKEAKERRTLFIILALIAYGASKFIPLLPRFKIRPLLAMLAAMMFIFSACSESKILLIEANYLASRGRYDEAIIPYQKALNYEDSAPYAEYGLGLTFYSFDEGVSALNRFESSQKLLEKFSPAEHRELRFRNNYNSGVVFFEEGDFHSAADSFKNALRADPRRIEAKHNLELSLMSIIREASEDNRPEQQRQETKEYLFGYLREQEQQKWKSREWSPEEKTTGPDY